MSVSCVFAFVFWLFCIAAQRRGNRRNWSCGPRECAESGLGDGGWWMVVERPKSKVWSLKSKVGEAAVLSIKFKVAEGAKSKVRMGFSCRLARFLGAWVAQFLPFWAGANGAPSRGTSRASTYTWSRETKFRHRAKRTPRGIDAND